MENSIVMIAQLAEYICDCQEENGRLQALCAITWALRDLLAQVELHCDAQTSKLWYRSEN